MKVINLSVTDKVKLMGIKEGDIILNANFPLKLAEGNYKSVIMNFEFASSTWTEEALTKFATFKINESKKVQVELTSLNGYANACYVPYDVFQENCKVEVGVYGIAKSGGNAEKIVSTEVIKMLIVDGSYNERLREENDISNSNAEKIEKELNDLKIIIGKKADINSIPVNISDLNNDSNFVNNLSSDLVNYYLKSETYSKEEIINLYALKTEIPGYSVLANTTASTTSPTNYMNYAIEPSRFSLVKRTESGAIKANTANADDEVITKGQADSTYMQNNEVPNHVKNITKENISDWNDKSTFSGSFNDLSNKPTIPTFTLDGTTLNINMEV